MRIAVAYEDGKVFHHFGSSKVFRLYEAEDGRITDVRTVENDAHGHDAVIEFLEPYSVDAVISGSVCAAGSRRMEGMGIKVYSGVKGDADAKVEELLAGRLLSDREKMSKSDIAIM